MKISLRSLRSTIFKSSLLLLFACFYITDRFSAKKSDTKEVDQLIQPGIDAMRSGELGGGVWGTTTADRSPCYRRMNK